jgi:hypothetical protein
MALGAAGCFGGPHPIPPEVFDRGGVGETPDPDNAGSGGAVAAGGSGGAAGVAGVGGAGGSGGAGGLAEPDAGGTHDL